VEVVVGLIDPELFAAGNHVGHEATLSTWENDDGDEVGYVHCDGCELELYRGPLKRLRPDHVRAPGNVNFFCAAGDTRGLRVIYGPRREGTR
jgi:hypothetical protein